MQKEILNAILSTSFPKLGIGIEANAASNSAFWYPAS
jgi:hypothetical protein